MNDWDACLFTWVAAGFSPNAALLNLAIMAATWGAGAGVMVMCTAAWKLPAERFYLLGAVLAGCFAAVLAHAVAASLNMPRPFVVGLSPVYVPHSNRGAMPSAHATVMFTVAAILFIRPSLRLAAIAMAIMGAATAWGRVYTGVHFPFDILGGLLLALCIAAAFNVATRIGTSMLAVPPRALLVKRRA